MRGARLSPSQERVNPKTRALPRHFLPVHPLARFASLFQKGGLDLLLRASTGHIPIVRGL